MTIICHRRQFIFLKSKKTAGTSIELWLAPNLDPEVDLISTGIEFKQQYPKVWKLFDSPSTQNRAYLEACTDVYANISPAHVRGGSSTFRRGS